MQARSRDHVPTLAAHVNAIAELPAGVANGISGMLEKLMAATSTGPRGTGNWWPAALLHQRGTGRSATLVVEIQVEDHHAADLTGGYPDFRPGPTLEPAVDHVSVRSKLSVTQAQWVGRPLPCLGGWITG